MRPARPPGPRPAPAAKSHATGQRPTARPGATRRASGSKPMISPVGTKPGRGPTRRRPDEGADHSQEREPRQITLRTLVLAIVVLLGFMLVAPTLGAYVRQQEQHRDLKAELADATDRATELQVAVDRWDDEEYVRNQARTRLGFVMPGETPYRVLDPETITGEAPPQDLDERAGPLPVDLSGPWYLTVRDSADLAGRMTDVPVGETEP